MANKLPNIKPRLRPYLPINNEAGAVLNIIAKNCNDKGTVTNALFSIKVKQTNAEAVINRLVTLIIKAWQIANKYTAKGIFSFV